MSIGSVQFFWMYKNTSVAYVPIYVAILCVILYELFYFSILVYLPILFYNVKALDLFYYLILLMSFIIIYPQ